MQAGALKGHQNTCQKSKNRLSLALAKAKEVLSSKKRQVAAVAADPLTDHEIQDNIPAAYYDVQVR